MQRLQCSCYAFLQHPRARLGVPAKALVHRIHQAPASTSSDCESTSNRFQEHFVSTTTAYLSRSSIYFRRRSCLKVLVRGSFPKQLASDITTFS